MSNNKIPLYNQNELMPTMGWDEKLVAGNFIQIIHGVQILCYTLCVRYACVAIKTYGKVQRIVVFFLYWENKKIFGISKSSFDQSRLRRYPFFLILLLHSMPQWVLCITILYG